MILVSFMSIVILDLFVCDGNGLWFVCVLLVEVGDLLARVFSGNEWELRHIFNFLCAFFSDVCR